MEAGFLLHKTMKREGLSQWFKTEENRIEQRYPEQGLSKWAPGPPMLVLRRNLLDLI
jgi:hypothetical protein